MARKRAIEAEETGIAHVVEGELVTRFLHSLPFALTGDQRRAIDAIAADMARPAPMHRLLQGEVGSGKTLVAITALLMAVQGGYQGALMAPTEVLAEQLHAVATSTLAELLVPSEGTLLAERPVSVALLTNRVGAADRRRIAAGLGAGDIDIVVGTHALLYGDAPFTKLGLAVIDEQHRFGVEQRALLRGLGDSPDVLVMTATPIPRTAAMLVYGDLDRSELREMPPGRTPVRTEVVGPSPLDRRVAYDRLREEVAAGRQAYVVCPLVEGSPKIEAKAATEELEELAGGELAGLTLGLLHGQMKSAEKEAAMSAFRAGTTQVLVATTVIEVGRRRAERDRHARGGRRSLRAVAAAPAAGPRRTGRRRIVVLPLRRPVDAGRPRAHGRHGGVQRRVPPRRARPRDPRIGAGVRRAPGRPRGPQARPAPARREVRGVRRGRRPRRSSTRMRPSRTTARWRRRSRTCSATTSSSCSRAEVR